MIRKPWHWAILVTLLTVSLCSLERVWSQQDPKALSIEERMKRDVTYLASAELEGRRPATKGMILAQDYVAKQFKEAGLQPFNKDGAYFQTVGVGTTSKLDGKTVVNFKGPGNKVIELKLGDDYQILGNSASGTLSAPLVFAGYGLSDNNLKFDEYKDLDVAGKIVVLISRTPRQAEKGKPFTPAHANLNNKFALAEKMKAAGIILINDAAVKGDALRTSNQTAGAKSTSVPAANVKRGRHRSGVPISSEEIPQRHRKRDRQGSQAAKCSAHRLVGHDRVQADPRPPGNARTWSASPPAMAHWRTKPWWSAGTLITLANKVTPSTTAPTTMPRAVPR